MNYLEWVVQDTNSTLEDKEFLLLTYAEKIKYASKYLKISDPNKPIAETIYEEVNLYNDNKLRLKILEYPMLGY